MRKLSYRKRFVGICTGLLVAFAVVSGACGDLTIDSAITESIKTVQEVEGDVKQLKNAFVDDTVNLITPRFNTQ